MNKYENIDIASSLEAIMRQNTAFYQSDFDTDKEIIQKAAVSPNAEDKTLLWFSRPCGTQCNWESDVFLKDTVSYNTWRYYGEQANEYILAYAITVTDSKDWKIKGNLYELNFMLYYKHILKKALPADTYTIIYEHGERNQPAKQYFDCKPDPKLGKFKYFKVQPNDPAALHNLLKQEQHNREQLISGNFKEHIITLQNNRIMREAVRILSKLQALKEPNSPKKKHFMVEVSPYFMATASSKDTDRLLSLLPFQTLYLSGLENCHGVYAFLSKEESRDKCLHNKEKLI